MATRIVHTQIVDGPLMLVDVDDGMPRKEFAYLKKQQTYVPYANPDDPTKAGYVDLVESDKVLMSQAEGTIKGMRDAGYAGVSTGFTPASPVVLSAKLFPTGLELTGTSLTSTLPAVTVFKSGADSVIQSDFQSLSATALVVGPTALPASVVVGSSVSVKADSTVSDAVTVVAG